MKHLVRVVAILTFLLSVTACVTQKTTTEKSKKSKKTTNKTSVFSYELVSYKGSDAVSGGWDFKKLKFKGPFKQTVLEKILRDLDQTVESWKCYTPQSPSLPTLVSHSSSPGEADIRSSVAFGEFTYVEITEDILSVSYTFDRRNCLKDQPHLRTGGMIYSMRSGNRLGLERNFTKRAELYNVILGKFQKTISADADLKARCQEKLTQCKKQKANLSFFAREGSIVFLDGTVGSCVLHEEVSSDEIYPYFMTRSPIRAYIGHYVSKN